MGNDGIAAVEKALVLLDCFKLGAEALSLVALAQALGIHRTMVYRLMSSLERMSHVTRSKSGTYPLGPHLLHLSKLCEQSSHLSPVMEPVLHALAAAARESALYYVTDYGRHLCLSHAEPSGDLHETRLSGISLPLDDTAIGHVLHYWGLGEALHDGMLGLPLFTPGVRDRHTAAFAIPVSGSGGKFMTALTPLDVTSRPEAMRTTGDFIAKQLRAAFELSYKLGANTALCERLYGA